MDVSEVSRIIVNAATHDYGNFYGSNLQNQPLGVGQIYGQIRYPIFNPEDQLYDTVEGFIYILSHECDIDSANERPFNDFVLISPIIPLDICNSHLREMMDDNNLSGFYSELGKDNVSRLSYFPPIAEYLPYGGVSYFNQITHTHITAFQLEDAFSITSLTANGLRIIDYKMANHLLRPKSVNLPLMKF